MRIDPERMHRVHTRERFAPPPGVWIRIRWRFGRNVRFETLWACDTVRPKVVFFPQISHTRAMIGPSDRDRPRQRVDPERTKQAS